MNNIFQKNNILVRGLLNTTYNFLQTTYNQTRNVFTTASAWGQILFVLENLSQLILYFIEDSITELNIYEATRDYSIRSLANIIKDKINFKGSIFFNKNYPNGVAEKDLNIDRIKKLGWKPKFPLNKGLDIVLKEIKI